jgi:hypothetical protein
MTLKNLLLLFAISLSLLLLVANFQSSPGYMDADYHLYVGQRLANSEGFSEQVIWNYLDDAQRLPHPSNSYWPPLPSLLAAVGIWLLPSLELFTAGRLASLIVTALIAPVTALLAFRMKAGKNTAWMASGLAVAPFFYFPFFSTTDSFGPSMLLGAIFFLLLLEVESESKQRFIPLALGVVAGLLHLTRAEGAVWLFIGFLGYFLQGKKGRFDSTAMLVTLAGYLLIMLPWFMRNQMQFGSLIAPGAVRSLWLTNYDQLFTFPATQLTTVEWLRSGWADILQIRLWALGQNLITGVAVQGEIFLAPLVIVAGWRMRERLVVRAAVMAWLILLMAMSVFFPFTGVRGGFFHAGAVLQPLIWTLAAAGLNSFVEWGAKRRGWDLTQATRIFRVAALIFVFVLSAFIVKQRVIGQDIRNPAWSESFDHYQEVELELDDMNVEEGAIVLVNNPPAYALASGRSAIVIPYGSIEATVAAAEQFGASILILEADHPEGLALLYEGLEVRKFLERIGTVGDTLIFRVSQASVEMK